MVIDKREVGDEDKDDEESNDETWKQTIVGFFWM